MIIATHIPLITKKITITGAGDNVRARRADERDKGVEFKNCAPFTNCISEINNPQVDNAKDIDTLGGALLGGSVVGCQ